MIGIVNYGSGNIQAIANIYKRLDLPFTVVSTPDALADVDRAILPGVGSFDQAMGELEASGLRGALERFVEERARPLLGICVGMQLLARSSEEGQARGLGFLDAVVTRFRQPQQGPRLQLPHLGWNTVEPRGDDPLFEGIDPDNGFYFLHSYYFECHDDGDVLALTEYGLRFSSAVRRQNVYGVQFHPEKSHRNGVQLLKNFAHL